jgi:dienelactone hydrolase
MKFKTIPSFYFVLGFMLCSAILGGWGDVQADCILLPEALKALESDRIVTVTKVTVAQLPEDSNFYYVFKPRYATPTVGFIVYPGAYAYPEAYAPAAHAIAAKGFLVAVVKMKQDLAIMSHDRAAAVINDNHSVEKWIIGGHSLGGVAACFYAYEHLEMFQGIVLWASYPAETSSLAQTDLKVISIYGTKDLGIDAIKASAINLPPDTQWVEIEGANHSQFCWCAGEPGENDIPDITREEQQAEINKATIAFLNQFRGHTCPARHLLGRDNAQLSSIRKFRDTVLAHNAVGQKLIELYYRNGEHIISVVERNRFIKKLAKILLSAVAQVLKLSA